jgi:outer membrane protein OmpA-like peptidoglycan-associated protein
MKALRSVVATALATLVLAACSTTPMRNAKLEEAQSAVSAARSNAAVTRTAGPELRAAEQALDRATALWRDGADAADVDHYAYLARERALLAQDMARLRTADEQARALGQAREQVLLQARTREADAAQQRAQAASQQAQEQARANERLQEQMRELQAQQTSRGMVVTLGDVLFDTGQAELRGGAMRQIDRLAAFLKENPQRHVVIEGFTDSTGSQELNYELSERRASAVRAALLDRGVTMDRIDVRPYGEAYPVASNDTAAGRQQNRRVEIVISDESGRVQTR